jgi:hypothetical protein
MRRSLIGTGATRKYLLYAVGEIMLVMIGILLALQVNNWNENQKKRILEKKVLTELNETLKENVKHLIGLQNGSEVLNNSSEIIISAIETYQNYHDSLNFHFQWARVVGVTPILSKGGYENFKNVGFEIIKSDSLRKEIISLFEVGYPSLIEFEKYFDSFHPDRQKYIDQHFYYSDEKPVTLIPFDYDNLMDNNYFLAMMKSIKVHRKVIITAIVRQFERTQKLVSLVEMLHFLRKIRRSLINSGHMRKYTL